MLDKAGVRLYIKRDDLLHPEFGGNKWRKLKYNLLAAQENQFKTLLTFGGAWSNHIYATAAAGHYFDFDTIGVIRGEAPNKLSETLSYAQSHNMVLKFVDRLQYRQKESTDFIRSLEDEFGHFYLLPEGGSNVLALKGVREIIGEIDVDFDVITSACGTGATLAGLVSGLKTNQSALGFTVLKQGGFLKKEVNQYLTASNNTSQRQWDVIPDYHFGGYAKTSDALFKFMFDFQKSFGIKIDAVYTAKMFSGLFDLIQKGYFKKGTRIIAIHTGGLQGNRGYEQLSNY